MNRHLFPFLEGKCWEGVPGCRGECVSVSKKLLVFSSVHLLVAGPLDSGDLPLSGPPHRLVRPSVPFWGRAQLRRQEEAQIPAQPASIALLRSAFTAGKRARGTGRSPTTGRLAGGRASATAAGAQRRPQGSVPNSHQRFLPRMPLCLGTRVLQGRERLWPDSGLHPRLQSPPVCPGVFVFRAVGEGSFVCSVTEVP